MSEKLEYKKESQFVYSDLDSNDNIFPSSILQLFQDVAGEHADILNIGYKDFLKNNWIWVLDKIKYTILVPKIELSKIIIKTWPLQPRLLEYNREFLITDINNTPLIKGSSRWCVLSIDTRKLVRTSTLPQINGEYLNEKNYADGFDILKPISKDEMIFSFKRKLLFTDLDHNKHVNNTKYSAFAIDSIPNIENSAIKDLQISFLKECMINQEMFTYYKQIDDNTYIINGYINNDTLSFIAKITLMK